MRLRTRSSLDRFNSFQAAQETCFKLWSEPQSHWSGQRLRHGPYSYAESITTNTAACQPSGFDGLAITMASKADSVATSRQAYVAGGLCCQLGSQVQTGRCVHLRKVCAVHKVLTQPLSQLETRHYLHLHCLVSTSALSRRSFPARYC
jgi:hypothetical protein